MITRYTLTAHKPSIATRFEIGISGSFNPIYNGHYQQMLPVITNENPNELTYMEWGLIPFNSVDHAIGDKLQNARIETIRAKAPFCDLISSKRCIIPADGFYIWNELNKSIAPNRVVHKNGLFGIAGIWESWKTDVQDAPFCSTFTMITTEANSMIRPITDRMPAIIPLDFEKKWLKGSFKVQELINLLPPIGSEMVEMHEVSNDIIHDLTNDIQRIQPTGKSGLGVTLNLFE